MDRWEENTYRFRTSPEDAGAQDTGENMQPVEGIGMAEQPITSVTWQEATEEPGEGYQVFTDPYGMPLEPDGSSRYAASTGAGGAAGNAGEGRTSEIGDGTGGSRESDVDYGRTGYRGEYEGGAGSGGSGGGYNGASGSGGHARRKPAPLQLTRRGFVLILILAMLLTSALTIGGIALIGSLAPKSDLSATHYTLTESKEQLDIASVVEKSNDGIVSITTEGISTDMWAQNYVTKGAGSGVIVQSDGYIVTCNHVVDDANKITVATTDSKTYEAEVVGTDPENDLAVLKIDAKGLHAVSYADSSKLEVGDRVVAIGNPLGQLSNTATTGIISALNRNLTIEGQKMNLLQTDASINPGNSGGALLDASGNLVGIVESKSAGSDVEGLGFAVPVNTVAKSVKEIIETGGVSHKTPGSSDSQTSNKAAIGVVIVDLSDEKAMAYGYGQGGVLITIVTSDNAKKADIRASDMITGVDGQSVRSSDDLSRIIGEHKPGDKVKVQLLRDGQTITKTTTLVKADE